jgi:hypothetical protein
MPSGEYQRKGRQCLTRWPAEVDRLERQLRRLDGEVRQFEVCRPSQAQVARAKASAVASRLEFLKRATLREECGE